MIDSNYLACQHHLYMSIGVNLVAQETDKVASCDVAIIGLGGGGLCTFIHQLLKFIDLIFVFLVQFK